MKKMEIWNKINERACADRLLYLFYRWEDEKDYEDIRDYLVPVKDMVPEAVQMYRRPFGFRAKAEDGMVKVLFKKKAKYIQVCMEEV